MHRFFIDIKKCRDDIAELETEDAVHAARVLRLKAGDEILLCDGNENQCRAILSDISSKQAFAKCAEWIKLESEAKCRITLYQSQPKSGKIENILQKGTELGIAAFGIFVSERSVVRDFKPKTERFTKVIREAARQSGRACIPEFFYIESKKNGKIGDTESLCMLLKDHQAVLLAYENETVCDLKKAVQGFQDEHGDALRDIAIIIGPEGGFSDEEVSCLCAAGAVSVSLGPRILRTETAGPALAAMLLFALGDMSN